jgi:hypothetical protein
MPPLQRLIWPPVRDLRWVRFQPEAVVAQGIDIAMAERRVSMICKNLLACLVLAIFVVASPATAGTPSPDVKPSPDVGWIVIGVQPENMRIEIKELRLKDGAVGPAGYHAFPLDMTMPTNGFIVFKARPGAVYGIVAASVMAKGGFFGMRFKACRQIAAFQAEGGKVVYFTSLTYSSSTGPAPAFGSAAYQGINYTQDFEGARSFLQTHYPGLSTSVEQGRYPMVPIVDGESCFV